MQSFLGFCGPLSLRLTARYQCFWPLRISGPQQRALVLAVLQRVKRLPADDGYSEPDQHAIHITFWMSDPHKY
jgi:hypothetical protein